MKKVKKVVIYLAVIIAFIIKLWTGFAPPVIEPGSIPAGAINDPLSVVISGIMTAVVVWIALEVLFLILSKIVISLGIHHEDR